jgi:hypothetical protein
VEATLRQLNTVHIDLLQRQVWDFTTSVEEILCGIPAAGRHWSRCKSSGSEIRPEATVEI